MVALPPKVACVALVAAVCALALVPAGATLPPTKIWSPWNAIYYHFDASATYAANTPSVNPPPAYFHKRLPDDGRIPAADVAAALAGNENYLYLFMQNPVDPVRDLSKSHALTRLSRTSATANKKALVGNAENNEYQQVAAGKLLVREQDGTGEATNIPTPPGSTGAPCNGDVLIGGNIYHGWDLDVSPAEIPTGTCWSSQDLHLYSDGYIQIPPIDLVNDITAGSTAPDGTKALEIYLGHEIEIHYTVTSTFSSYGYTSYYTASVDISKANEHFTIVRPNSDALRYHRFTFEGPVYYEITDTGSEDDFTGDPAASLAPFPVGTGLTVAAPDETRAVVVYIPCGAGTESTCFNLANHNYRQPTFLSEVSGYGGSFSTGPVQWWLNNGYASDSSSASMANHLVQDFGHAWGNAPPSGYLRVAFSGPDLDAGDNYFVTLATYRDLSAQPTKDDDYRTVAEVPLKAASAPYTIDKIAVSPTADDPNIDFRYEAVPSGSSESVAVNAKPGEYVYVSGTCTPAAVSASTTLMSVCMGTPTVGGSVSTTLPTPATVTWSSTDAILGPDGNPRWTMQFQVDGSATAGTSGGFVSSDTPYWTPADWARLQVNVVAASAAPCTPLGGSASTNTNSASSLDISITSGGLVSLSVNVPVVAGRSIPSSPTATVGSITSPPASCVLSLGEETCTGEGDVFTLTFDVSFADLAGGCAIDSVTGIDTTTDTRWNGPADVVEITRYVSSVTAEYEETVAYERNGDTFTETRTVSESLVFYVDAPTKRTITAEINVYDSPYVSLAIIEQVLDVTTLVTHPSESASSTLDLTLVAHAQQPFYIDNIAFASISPVPTGVATSGSIGALTVTDVPPYNRHEWSASYTMTAASAPCAMAGTYRFDFDLKCDAAEAAASSLSCPFETQSGQTLSIGVDTTSLCPIVAGEITDLLVDLQAYEAPGCSTVATTFTEDSDVCFKAVVSGVDLTPTNVHITNIYVASTDNNDDTVSYDAPNPDSTTDTQIVSINEFEGLTIPPEGTSLITFVVVIEVDYGTSRARRVRASSTDVAESSIDLTIESSAGPTGKDDDGTDNGGVGTIDVASPGGNGNGDHAAGMSIGLLIGLIGAGVAVLVLLGLAVGVGMRDHRQMAALRAETAAVAADGKVRRPKAGAKFSDSASTTETGGSSSPLDSSSGTARTQASYRRGAYNGDGDGSDSAST